MHALIAYEHGQFSQKRVVLARPFLIHRAEQGFAALYYIWHEYYGFGRDYRELSRWSLGDRGSPLVLLLEEGGSHMPVYGSVGPPFGLYASIGSE